MKRSVTARSYRNRRIGEFLKELQFTEGRSTGIPKIRRTMQLNGSPAPLFETDVERTYFLTTLPVHAEFQVTIIKQNQPPVNYGVYPSEKGKIVLEFCREPRSRVDILQKIGVSNQTKNYQNYILAFVQAGFLQLTIPNKPTSRHQQYILTSAGEEFLNANQTVTK
jgi:ATP-dependent DNA helicase RecG